MDLNKKRMKPECQSLSDRLFEIALGRSDEEALSHVATCVDCSRELALYREIVAAARTMMASAPAEAISAAKGLVTSRSRTVAIRRLGLGQQVRGSALKQASFEAGEVAIRVLASQSEHGWILTGRVEASGEAKILYGADEIPLDREGRFQIRVASLSESGFEVKVGGDWIEVPALDAGDDEPE